MAILFFIYLIPIFALLSLFLQSIAARRGRNFTGTVDQRHERENEQTGCQAAQRWPQHRLPLPMRADADEGRSLGSLQSLANGNFHETPNINISKRALKIVQ
jgi:hypothetical protein